ncbi:hypothetical protein BJ875DRAFT_440299 [Amylocarpus encephaloides]|uniref:Threonine/serine exporter-like N-terminal domain-containing protein n=1 Tax=Amylocarpus encephaloides TaxID=45428 RepID=A0A9P8C7V5_9HELO|nr:hypothetical protein BJ875DRAFT_440299 [Amylocarpus encephaloides]
MSTERLSAGEGGSHHQRGYSEISNLSGDSSANPSRPNSPLTTPQQKHRGRVRFNSTSEANDAANRRSSFPLRDRSQSPPIIITTPKQTKLSPADSRNNSVASLMIHSPKKESENPFVDPVPPHAARPNLSRHSSIENAENEKAYSALAAQERAQRNARSVSAPSSRRSSLEEEEDELHSPRRAGNYPVRIDDIPLVDMSNSRSYNGVILDDSDHEEERHSEKQNSTTSEAHKLVRAHTRKAGRHIYMEPPGQRSGHVTPTEDQHFSEYVPVPEKYRGGVLSSLLKLYNPTPGHATGSASTATSRRNSNETESLGSSGLNTPKTKSVKWYNSRDQSQDTLAGLIEASAILANTPGAGGSGSTKPKRPGPSKRTSSSKLMNKLGMKPRLEDEIKVIVHIADILSRQKYLLKMCRALMVYGAPTHRLEEYLKMSARVLEIDVQSLYIPGCMIVSFADPSTHTTDVQLIKANQAVNLGKLKDIHEIYKEVIHDIIGVEEAIQRLDDEMKKKPKYNKWLLILVYGIASATVGPFAFEARYIDLPIAFILGAYLGFIKIIMEPKSDSFSNVFEMFATVSTSFLARAFGSLRGGNLFCFSALAQSSIALILPGYMVLCASLEMQSKSMVAGAVRMVYALIYSLFLGFGITIGTWIYGAVDGNASSATTCQAPLGSFMKWIFVPLFTLSLCIINQAKWKQIPIMLLISMTGYIVNFFAALKFPTTGAPIANAFGALAIGVLGNLYSRIRHGVAAAAILPAIFVQVPSGLAAAGSLLAGISSADQITNSTTYLNGTSKLNGTLVNTINVDTSGGMGTSNPLFNVGVSMVQVAVGITVGLFLSAFFVYPFGKKRSGLFSF